MAQYPSELYYAKSHEWVRRENDGSYTIGITEHAQELLGDMVYVELPDVGDELSAGEEMGVVESVKAASDVYSPLSGEIIAVNEKLADAPEKVNKDPYGTGWLCRIKPSDESEIDDLLDAEEYGMHVESEDH